MAQPTILLAAISVANDIDHVIAAMGHGSRNMLREIVATNDPSTTLYRLGLDMGADADYAAALRAMAEAQALPEISGEWGAGGVISAVDAQAAMLGFKAFTAAGVGINGTEWVSNVLMAMGLTFLPDPQ